MAHNTERHKTGVSQPDWSQTLSIYGRPNLRRALWQISDTFIPYIALWALMVYLVTGRYSYWITLPLAVVAGMLLVRIFIIFHDCCHGSFFAWRPGNKILGYIAGILVFTPYDEWRSSHARHHVTAGDLDRRGTGDIWTMTVAEYKAASKLRRLGYRIYRNPLVMFFLGSAYLLLVSNRFSHKGARRHERRSVIYTNLAILALIILASLFLGFHDYIVIQLPVIVTAGIVGIWLFYVQHQFQGVYWSRHALWDPTRAALEGSSYYRLPTILQWLTGNIGLHHIHHMRPRIPNYNLQDCYDAIPELRDVTPVTLRGSLASIGMKLWDEEGQKMVGFSSIKTGAH